MKPRENPLRVGLLVLYSAASLLHFAHDAEYPGDYPNLPAWLTRSGVHFAWAAWPRSELLATCSITTAAVLLFAVVRAVVKRVHQKMALTVDRGR